MVFQTYDLECYSYDCNINYDFNIVPANFKNEGHTYKPDDLIWLKDHLAESIF